MLEAFAAVLITSKTPGVPPAAAAEATFDPAGAPGPTNRHLNRSCKQPSDVGRARAQPWRRISPPPANNPEVHYVTRVDELLELALEPAAAAGPAGRVS